MSDYQDLLVKQQNEIADLREEREQLLKALERLLSMTEPYRSDMDGPAYSDWGDISAMVADKRQGENPEPSEQQLGTFAVRTGRLMLTDPCYQPETWCQIDLTNVKNGNWRAFTIRNREGRNAWLCAVHEDQQGGEYYGLSGEIGVDSGQAGIFDHVDYVLGKQEDEKDPYASYTELPFYGACCKETLKEPYAGIVLVGGNPVGAVSQAGYGDGAYRAFASRDLEGLVVGVEIEFISEED